MKAPTRRLHQPLDPADYRRCDSAQIAGPASFVGRPSSGTLLGPLTGALPTPPVGALVLFGGAVFGAAGEHSEVGELLAVLGAELVALGTVGDTQCVEFVPVLLTEFGELRATAPRPRQLQPPTFDGARRGLRVRRAPVRRRLPRRASRRVVDYIKPASGHRSAIALLRHRSTIALLRHRSTIALLRHRSTIALLRHRSTIALLRHRYHPDGGAPLRRRGDAPAL